MPDPITAAGALKNPTRFSALTMGARQMTGMVTQKAPYRDGMVPYLVGKFYGGSRFDTIWDGLNREINQKLCDQRAPGSAVWNDNDFVPIAGFYPWKYIQDGTEKIRVLVDCPADPDLGADDGILYDASNGGKVELYVKGRASGPARFLGVNTQLYITDGEDNIKVIGTSKTWQPGTPYGAGDLILDTNGNLQQAFSAPLVRNVLGARYFSATDPGGTVTHYVQVQLDDFMDFPTGQGSALPVTLAGLTTKTYLNGAVLTQVVPAGAYGTLLQGVTTVSHGDDAFAADTGTATGVRLTNDESTGTLGASGLTQPTWATTQQATTADGSGLTWMNFGQPVKDWMLKGPAKKPTVSAAYNTETYWQPNTQFGDSAAVIDSNGQLEISAILAPATTGPVQPAWNTSLNGQTFSDGGISWYNGGTAGTWYMTSLYSEGQCVLDSNGNIQQVESAGGISGATMPIWATTPGTTTTDGALTWICAGPGTVLRAGTVQYGFSFHMIDGSVTNSSPVNATVVNGVLGDNVLGYAMQVVGPNPADAGIVGDLTQIDQVWVWRTVVGGSLLINLAQFPVDDVNSGTWSYLDVLDDTQLNAFIAAPVASEANPPQVGMSVQCYYLQRVWGIYQNVVVYSGGPDTVVGNGNTTFPPLNEIPLAAQPIWLQPIGVQGGGLIVMTTSGIYIVLGGGTGSDPFYVADYFALVSVTGYNAVKKIYNQIYCMESNGKVSSIAIEYPFNPQSGYAEVGFPIGDQFVTTTTGGVNAKLFNPATAYLAWNVNSSADTGMYVADGATGWFRMSIINPPESGLLWSPLRQIVGGTSAVDSVETAPGVHELLIGPPAAGGPILVRDTTGTVRTDNGVPYDAWDAKGVTLLCSTGQWASVEHISAKSKPVGARPVVSVLLNEIEPSEERPYSVLQIAEKSNDPPRNRRSISAYSDRYTTSQNGDENTGDCILVKFDYGAQDEADELWDWGIFASVKDEREEQAQR